MRDAIRIHFTCKSVSKGFCRYMELKSGKFACSDECLPTSDAWVYGTIEERKRIVTALDTWVYGMIEERKRMVTLFV